MGIGVLSFARSEIITIPNPSFESLPGSDPAHFDANGKLRSFVNVYLGDEDIRFLPEKGATALPPGAELSIVPSIAGGAR